jgi:uncharacterized protein (DUF1330 family)
MERNQQAKEGVDMNAKFKIALAVAAGSVLGAAAMHGLHAQAKPKAFSVTEIEVIDAAAQAVYAPVAVAEVGFAGGRPINSPGGTITALVGEAPKRVAITEWATLDKARAFYDSKDWKRLAPQRDKAQKVIRQYLVENPN